MRRPDSFGQIMSPLEVEVRNDNIEAAIKSLKKKVQNDGSLRRITERNKGLLRKRSIRLRLKHGKAIGRLKRMQARRERLDGHGLESVR